MGSASFWTLMVVGLNTPNAAVEIRPLVDSPAFQTEASCNEFAKSKNLTNTVCFTGGAALELRGKTEKQSDRRSNLLIVGSEWGGKQ